jgi:uncharacterized protein (TIGR02600 family)
MNPQDHPKPVANRRKRGIALITVISMIALSTILLLAFLTTADSEFNSTRVSADGDAARRLADDAVAIVIGQIQAGSRQANDSTGREFHATQPGLVRQYKASGEFFRGYKLYSDEKMVETANGTGGESNLANDNPPGDWDTRANNNHARYVDLNAPVVRARYQKGGAGGDNTEVIFPIIDPRAAYNDARTNHDDRVEGFEINEEAKLGSGEVINGVVMTGADADTFRSPMPVEWLYVLKSGVTGTLDGNMAFRSATTGEEGTPSESNPIVGRIAFWTDDEGCKINVNTASEPTFWMTPHFYSDRDKNWNDCPPVKYEYQRYPGHPATVALSSVFFPNENLDMYSSTNQARAMNFREAIYEMSPKISKGGSQYGTLPFDPDSYDARKASPIAVSEVSDAMQEPLFISLDEMRFTSRATNNRREIASVRPNGEQELLSPNFLERSRFFLTANSRAPDFSIMGVPKVAIWPIPHSSLGNDYRTVQDSMVQFCSTLKTRRGDALFAFQRRSSTSQLEDVQDQRNNELLSYLYTMMTKTWPGNSTGGGISFVEKYNQDDARQIIVQIFDYIRCTNLYDSQLSLEGEELQRSDGSNPTGNKFDNPIFDEGRKLHAAKDWTKLYEYRDKLRNENAFKTFTDPHYKIKRVGDDREPANTDFPSNLQWEVLANGFPGHGQVSPARWNVGGKDYQGFGRNVTISEAALHFICTGDGRNDNGSFRLWNAGYNGKSNSLTDISGGRTAPRTDFDYDYTPNQEYRVRKMRRPANAPQETMYWYSNYPPYPEAGRYGCSSNANDNSVRGMRHHPGYEPGNWNATLQDGTPLAQNERRVQLLLQLELFCPSVGWTGIDPEYTIVLDGTDVSGIEVNGKAVYSTTSNLVVKSGRPAYGTSNASVPRYDTNAHRVGGTGDVRSMVEGRRTKPIGRTYDPGYDVRANDRPHSGLINLDLMSNFFTVAGDEFTFEVKRPIKVRLYDKHDWQSSEPLQEFDLKFPDGPTKTLTPNLVTISSPHRITVDQNTGAQTLWYACQAPRFWVFNYTGCVDVFTGSAPQYVNQITLPIESRTSVSLKSEAQLLEYGTGGRFRTTGAFSRIRGNSHGETAFRLPLIHYDPNNSSSVSVTVSHGARIIWGVTETSIAETERFYYANNARIRKQFQNDVTRNFGFDIIRSIIPYNGDYRLTAARRFVPQDAWKPHPLWTSGGDNDVVMAHNLSGHLSTLEPGFDRTGQTAAPSRPNNGNPKTYAQYRLTPNADYREGQIPDFPMDEESSVRASRYRDWDNAVGNTRDGAYINKPDEGNFSKLPFYLNKNFVELRNAYLFDTMESSQGSPSYFTPNRMISSPAMFGSLPTGVFAGVPWRTLLFRPDPNPNNPANSHPGISSPPDHYILDLFQMPVVEPYAISEPTSVAGRINVNHQILPFTNIKRATGLHALLKGEMMTAIPTEFAPYYKTSVNLDLNRGGSNEIPQAYWSEKEIDPRAVNTAATGIGPTQRALRSFHRRINVSEFVRQLDERFYNLGNISASKIGLLRAPGQICEIHMIPEDLPPAIVSQPGYPPIANVSASRSDAERDANMAIFWNANGLTGDNLKERPYANMLSKVTTRSNTFRVFVRAQSLRKARSSPVDVFDPDKDSVVAEYRGTRLLERYIDPSGSETQITDYASQQDPYSTPALDEYYRFRVLESKRFDP